MGDWCRCVCSFFLFFKQKTAYELRVSYWSSVVCSSDLSDVCDGWAVNQRFRLAVLYEDGLSVSYGWSLSSWESKDGGRYRFFIRRFDGSGESESVRGEAELAADGSGRAVFHAPEDRKSTRLNSSH